MLYFRIKPEADQRRRPDGSIYIARELYTPAEKRRFAIPEKYLDQVEISRKKIYFFFGARFEMEA